jgi:adenylate kinase
MEKLVLVFLGPPGVGKGTQAAKLASELNLPHISTGDIFRDHLKRNTELGRMAREFMDDGRLVPDKLVVDLVADRTSQADCERGYILDGFPRTVNQAEELDRVLTNRMEGVSAVLYFDAPREVVIERISGRARKEGRSDDTPETVKKRLEEYDEQTGPLVPHFREMGLLHEFEATRTIDEIYAQVRSTVQGLTA